MNNQVNAIPEQVKQGKDVNVFSEQQHTLKVQTC